MNTMEVQERVQAEDQVLLKMISHTEKYLLFRRIVTKMTLMIQGMENLLFLILQTCRVILSLIQLRSLMLMTTLIPRPLSCIGMMEVALH